MKRFLALTTLLILTACTAATVELVTPTAAPSDTPLPPTGTSTATSTNTVTPTNTPSSTPSPTSTPTSGPSPTPSLTPTLSSWIEQDFLFGGPIIEGCDLPCWQGLTPGISSADEVDQVFTQIFGYGRYFDMIESAVAANQIDDWPFLLWAQPHYILDYGVSPYDMGDSASFVSSAWLDEKIFQLSAVRFGWNGLGPLADYTPTRFIKELGQPSQLLITIFSPDRSIPPEWSYELVLLYEEQGLIYAADVAIPDAPDDGVNVCLDGPYWSGWYEYSSRFVILTQVSVESFPTPAQDFLLTGYIYAEWLRPFEIMLGVPLKEVTQQV
jgi:hypothetical protein